MEEKKNGDVYSRVTAHIVRAIEEGAGEFKMPWHRPAGELMPTNVASKNSYRGVNLVSLWSTADVKGYSESLWGTYRQWNELGAQVRKAETATPVVFWQTTERPAAGEAEVEKEANARRGFIAKGYYVFNVAQVDGYARAEVAKLSEAERNKQAEAFLFGVGADIRHGGGAAYYQPSSDHIQLPPYEVFRSVEGYYSTVAHELTHWTAAAARLGRDLKNRFGTEAYAAEELVAELGAAFQLARLEFSSEPRPDHAAYVSSWLSLLKHDTRAIFTAAGKAEEACTFLSKEHERLQGVAQEQAPPQEKPAAFAVEELGTVWRFTPLTNEAMRFAKGKLDLERWQWIEGGRFVLDHRLARDAVAILEREGLPVTGHDETRTRQHER